MLLDFNRFSFDFSRCSLDCDHFSWDFNLSALLLTKCSLDFNKFSLDFNRFSLHLKWSLPQLGGSTCRHYKPTGPRHLGRRVIFMARFCTVLIFGQTILKVSKQQIPVAACAWATHSHHVQLRIRFLSILIRFQLVLVRIYSIFNGL